jgi:DNA-binding NarL/FixJ family response regulator
MPETRPRVLLADDHPLMLQGLRQLLEPEYAVVGAVLDGHALLEAAKAHRPDLVLVDISMPKLNGIEATRQLQSLAPAARVLILSLHTDPEWVHAAFEAGACGYLAKSSTPAEIKTALREVLEDRFYVSPAVTQGIFSPLPRRTATPAMPTMPTTPTTGQAKSAAQALTPREGEIVRLVGKGLRNKEIAQTLGVSVATVRTHLSRIYEKLAPGNRVELALYAAHAVHA